MRKYFISMIKKNPDTEQILWRIMYGKQAKDFKGKEVWMPDDHEDHTLAELRDKQDSLQKNLDRVTDMIKAIEKEIPKKEISNNAKNNK